MSRTKFGKTRPIDKPYATYEGMGPFGYTEMRVLKTYQSADNEEKNAYPKWFVAMKSDSTYGDWSMGDSYISDALYGLDFKSADDEWLEEYA